MNLVSQLEALGTASLIGIGALVALQLALAVTALVSLARTPAERLRAPKWVWVLVIVFGELVGPVLYLALARKPEPVDLTPAYRTDQGSRPASEVADLLYGTPESPGPSLADAGPDGTASGPRQ